MAQRTVVIPAKITHIVGQVKDWDHYSLFNPWWSGWAPVPRDAASPLVILA